MNHVSVFRQLLGGSMAVVAALVLAAPVAASAEPSSQFGGVDAYVRAQMADAHLPGLALGLVHDGQVVHVRGFGVADPRGQAVSAATPFIIGSVSKSFTAVAVMQLVETGRVQLDAPAVDYVSDFKLADVNDSDQITVRQLLNQTSGIPTEAGIDPLSAPASDLDTQVRELSAVKPASGPGAVYAYSNANYEVLGRLVEDVSGLTFGAYLQDRIFTPLGMTHSYTSADRARAAGLAGGCTIWFGVDQCAQPGSGFRADFVPAGFVMSSAADMSQYMLAQLNDVADGGKGILSPADVALMHTPAAHAGVSAQGGSYGMGWFIGPRAGIDHTIWHDGSAAGTHSMVLLLPDTGWGIVVLTNAESLLYSMLGRIDVIADGIAAQLTGAKQPGTISGLYYAFDAVILLLFGLQVLRFIRLLRRPNGVGVHKGRVRFVLIEIALPAWRELVLPVGIVVGLPAVLSAPWNNLVHTDVGVAVLALGTALLLTGAVRVYKTRTLWLRALSRVRRDSSRELAVVAN